MSATIFFDFETAGLEPHHPSIQLGAIAIDDQTGTELGAFEVNLKFQVSAADPEALAMNHYSADAWNNAVYPVEAARRMAQFCDPYRCVEMVSRRSGQSYTVAKLAGYNAITFDMPRLRQLFDGQFFPFSYHVRDILQRVLFYFDEHPEEPKPSSLKLDTVCAYFGIEIGNIHNAVSDSRLTAALARKLR